MLLYIKFWHTVSSQNIFYVQYLLVFLLDDMVFETNYWIRFSLSFSPLFFCPSTEGLVLPPDQLKGQLEFCDVSFAYPTRKEAPIFQNLNLMVPAGTVMAVVGASGSGKSTLVSLLLRLYDTDAGQT